MIRCRSRDVAGRSQQWMAWESFGFQVVCISREARTYFGRSGMAERD